MIGKICIVMALMLLLEDPLIAQLAIKNPSKPSAGVYQLSSAALTPSNPNDRRYISARIFVQQGSLTESVSGPFRTIPISEWVGERFVFLSQQSIFQKYGYQLIYKTDQRIGSLPYREYVGRIVRVTSVRASSVSGSWDVELVVEDNGERLRALAATNRIKGLGLVADLENARTRFKGRTLWLQNSPLQMFKAASDEVEFVGVDTSKPISVLDVVASWSDDAPVRFVIQTANGTRGFRDVNMSGTNVSEILRKYHTFDAEFSTREPRNDSTVSIGAVPSQAQPPATSKQSDVLGWQDARWGMIEADILKAFGTALQKLPKKELFQNAYVDYVIPDFKINRETFTVRFQMDSRTKRLAQVLIRLDQMESSAPRTDAFLALEELLNQKYGVSSYKKDETETVVSHDRRWIFSTTIIELSYSYIRSISSSGLTIRYFPASSSEANKL